MEVLHGGKHKLESLSHPTRPDRHSREEKAGAWKGKSKGHGSRAQDAQMYMDVTYRQFLKYLRLLRIGEESFLNEINKDQDELEMQYRLLYGDYEEDEEDENPEEIEGDEEKKPDSSNPQSAKGQGDNRHPSGKGEKLHFPPIATESVVNENRGGSSDKGVQPVSSGRKLSAGSQHSDVKEGAEHVAPGKTGKSKLLHAFRSLKNTLVMTHKTPLPRQISKNAMVTARRLPDVTRESAKARSRNSSSSGKKFGGNKFPSLNNVSEESPKKRKDSIVVDWDRRKMSLERLSSDRWMIVRDEKYPKQVEREKSLEKARQNGNKKIPDDVPPTFQRWKYVCIGEPKPLRFYVTYNGGAKKKPLPPWKKETQPPQPVLKKGAIKRK